MSLELRAALVVGLVVAGFGVWLLAQLRPRTADVQPDAPGGQRKDTATRARVIQLERRYTAIARGLVLAFITLGVAVTVGLVLQGRRADELSDVVAGQQASRIAALVGACESRNNDHRSIQRFVTTVAPSLAASVADVFPAFPQRHQPELCRREALRKAEAP